MEFFDQKKWVAEHAKELKGKNVQEVFRYVTANHPNMGCALPWHLNSSSIDNELKKMKEMTLEELAKYADAVAVACVDEVATGPISKDTPFTNETSVGNAAYIALYSSNEQIRTSYTQLIETWKTE
jgi:hypothetical protein